MMCQKMKSNKIYIFKKEKSDANFGSSQVCESFKENMFFQCKIKKGKIINMSISYGGKCAMLNLPALV